MSRARGKVAFAAESWFLHNQISSHHKCLDTTAVPLTPKLSQNGDAHSGVSESEEDGLPIDSTESGRGDRYRSLCGTDFPDEHGEELVQVQRQPPEADIL